MENINKNYFIHRLIIYNKTNVILILNFKSKVNYIEKFPQNFNRCSHK